MFAQKQHNGIKERRQKMKREKVTEEKYEVI